MTSPTTPAPLDLKNVQGDIVGNGLPKKAETYYFFGIDDAHVKTFRSQLGELIPLITTVEDVMGHRENIAQHKASEEHKGRWLKLSGVNIAFSQKGLKQLGFEVDGADKIGDAPFEGSMINDSTLNDLPATWFPEFRKDIHGLIVVTGECQFTIDEKLHEILRILKGTVFEIKRADGHVRPGKEDGHEHFGYLDGISQPAVSGVDKTPFPGQETVRQGIILLGREGDTATRPSWSLDGSFLTFRYLSQLVPEFQGFVDKHNPPGAPKDLIGARLVGRWKSGAPVDIDPLKDDPVLGPDPERNNNFQYDPLSQSRCPFAAHTRKTNPRSDLAAVGGVETHRILRRGIQFGPEVDEEERDKGATTHDRGLLFKAYQSNNVNGFQFIQKNWANQPLFPFLNTPGTPKPGFTTTVGPGFDVIIGQAPNDGDRDIILTTASDPAGKLDAPVEWVKTRGGEYFFSPSIPALKSKFALAKPPAQDEL